MERSIPARLIQTGKSRKLPLLPRAAVAGLTSLNPDFEWSFFDDEGVEEFMRREFSQHREIFAGFPFRIQRYDFFRYLAVYRLGGFYFDLDVFLASPLADLQAHRCVFPFEELTLNKFLRRQHGIDWEIGNYAFAAAPGHPFLEAVIENCVRAQRDPGWVKPMMQGIPALFRSEFHVLNTTGPGLLTRTLAENPQLHDSVSVLFPDDVCNEENWHCFGDYGVHLMEGSWRDRGGFLHRRLAALWENWTRKSLMRESVARGGKRTFGVQPVTSVVFS